MFNTLCPNCGNYPLLSLKLNEIILQCNPCGNYKHYLIHDFIQLITKNKKQFNMNHKCNEHKHIKNTSDTKSRIDTCNKLTFL